MRKIFNILFVCLSLALASCTFEEASYFETGSAQRANQAIEDYYSILTSSPNGWVMYMYPEANRSYGGFNVLCKFSTDGKVTVASPVTGDYEYTADSFYTIKQSAGIVLSFDSYNDVFHLFCDPEDPFGIGGTGYGLEGDYDFQIISASSEMVKLKGKKSGSYSTLIPAPEDWEAYMASIDLADMEVCGYSRYVLHAGDKTADVSLNAYNFKFTTVVEDKKTDIDGPFVLIPGGCLLYEPVTVYGYSISGFLYDIETENLISVDNPDVYLTPYVAPLNEQLATGDWFISYNNVSAAVKSSFDKAYNGALEGEGERVVYLALCNGSHMISSYSDIWGLFFYMDAGYKGQYEMTATFVGEDKIKLEWSGAGQGDYSYYRSYCNYDYFLNVFGNSGKPKTFTITTDNVKHPSYLTLTDDANPDIEITVVPDMVSFK